MSQSQVGNPAPELKPVALGVALLMGRIIGKPRSYKSQAGEQRFATLVKLPNPSEFESAGTVEIQSAERLGDAGDTWRGRVRITGSVRPFGYTDRVTGESKSGTDVTIRLTVAE